MATRLEALRAGVRPADRLAVVAELALLEGKDETAGS